MSDTGLVARTPLQGFNITQQNTTVAETPQLTIVSLAFSASQIANLEDVLKSSLDLSMPKVGHVSRSQSGKSLPSHSLPSHSLPSHALPSHSLLRLQSDQCLLVTHEQWPRPVEHLQSLCNRAACYTNQSDSWVVLDIKGPCWRLMLERICSLDLSDSSFSTQHVARTNMEHMSVILERPASEHVRLYTLRSYARSFAHAVETSLRYVSEPRVNEE